MSKIKYLIKKYHITPNNNLDQHFLKDYNKLMEIISAAKIRKTDVVLEIGAGLGFLTKNLAKKAKKVIAIERDEQFKEVLETELAGLKNVELKFKNALKITYPPFHKIVSNLPYNLCEPLLHKLQHYQFELGIILTSYKFAQKMIGKGHIGELCKRYNVKIIGEIPPESFYPKPKVKSVIVRINKKRKI